MARMMRLLVAAVLMVGITIPIFANGHKESTQGSSSQSKLTKIVWVSPRGTLQVMDDYDLWVAKKMGYFKDLGLSVKLEPGPNQALAGIKLVAQGKADVAYPSPGVLTSGINEGVPVVMAFDMAATQVFDFAVAKDSNITNVHQIAGKTIALNFAGWNVIVNPILMQLGISPKDVKYQAVGSEWGQAVAEHKADVALTWEGLRAQWNAIGLKLHYFIGRNFSNLPSNGYAVRTSDLNNPQKRATLVKFFRGVAMGLEFARANPRAAAQITYSQFPALQKQMTPKLALESMHQLEQLYVWSKVHMGEYGLSPVDHWKEYLKILAKLGQTSKQLPVDEVVTNAFIKEANNFNAQKVDQQAKDFKLNSTWQNVAVTGNW